MATQGGTQEAAAVWVAVDDLTPWADNPRHNDEAVPEVAASIRRFGFAAPIVARRADGMVIAGHTRLAAARSLGLDRVPVRFMDLDPADAKLLAIADNKVGEIAEWDNVKLGEVLAGLRDEGVLDELAGVGFIQQELDMMLNGAGAIDEDEWSDALGGLASGDRAPLQSMSFMLHDDQAETVRRALEASKAIGDFTDTGNENGNGNALARICELWLGVQHG